MARTIEVSYSELDAYRQCPHKHALAYRFLWASPSVGRALGIGLRWHKVMEIHYGHVKDGSTEMARMQSVAEYLMESDTDEETTQLLGWMYDGHVERWGNDDQWEIMAIEEQGRQRLLTPRGFPSRFVLRRRIDLVVRDRSFIKPKIFVVDHKSGQNLPSDRELDLDDQMGLYNGGLKRQGVPVFGIIYSAARTQRNKVVPQPLEERFSRTRLYRTDKELKTIAVEAYRTFKTAYSISADDAPRAPDSERCRWRCPFTEPCLAGRKGVDEVTFLRAKGFAQLSEAEHWRTRGYLTEPGREEVASGSEVS
jgi:hypothetical protein